MFKIENRVIYEIYLFFIISLNSRATNQAAHIIYGKNYKDRIIKALPKNKGNIRTC